MKLHRPVSFLQGLPWIHSPKPQVWLDSLKPCLQKYLALCFSTATVVAASSFRKRIQAPRSSVATRCRGRKRFPSLTATPHAAHTRNTSGSLCCFQLPKKDNSSTTLSTSIAARKTSWCSSRWPASNAPNVLIASRNRGCRRPPHHGRDRRCLLGWSSNVLLCALLVSGNMSFSIISFAYVEISWCLEMSFALYQMIL